MKLLATFFIFALPCWVASAATTTVEELDHEEVDVTPPLIESIHAPSQNKSIVAIVDKYTEVSHARQAGSSHKRALVDGDKIHGNDTILTDGGRLRVNLANGTVITLGAHSAVGIEGFEPNMKLRFYYGLAHIDADAVDDKTVTVLKTTNAMIRLVGKTDYFLFQPVQDKDLNIHVLNGKATVTSIITNQTMPVPDHTGLSLRASGLLVELGSLNDKLLQMLQEQSKL